VIFLASQASIRVTVVVHLGKGPIDVVYYSVPIPIGYPCNVLEVLSLSDVYYAFLPFPSYNNIHIGAGSENLFYTIGRLLPSHYGGNGRGERVHKLTDFTKMVLPIYAYAEQIDFFLGEAFEFLGVAQRIRKPQIQEGQFLYVRAERRGDIFQTNRRKHGQAQRSGMAVPKIWMKTKGVLIQGGQTLFRSHGCREENPASCRL